MAASLVELGIATRSLKNHGMREGASTRLLIYAAKLIGSGMSIGAAAEATLVQSLTDDADLIRALQDLIQTKLG